MRPASYKIYCTPFESFWCCTGTGIQAPAKFGKMFYAHNGDSLFVNMYSPSTLNWKEKSLRLRMETDFPRKNNVQLKVEGLERSKRMAIALRCPWWSKGVDVRVNGKKVNVEKKMKDGYVVVSRKWRRGDQVEVELHPELRAEVVKGGSEYYAFMYGPVLLGVRIADDKLTMNDYRQARRTVQRGLAPMEMAPEIIRDVDKVISNMERCDSDDVLRFRVPESCASKEFFLEPYNDIHFSRYAIYLHLMGK